MPIPNSWCASIPTLQAHIAAKVTLGESKLHIKTETLKCLHCFPIIKHIDFKSITMVEIFLHINVPYYMKYKLTLKKSQAQGLHQKIMLLDVPILKIKHLWTLLFNY